MTDPIKVHITGVYGLIGNLVYKHLSQWPAYYELYGSGRRTMSSRRADENAAIGKIIGPAFASDNVVDAVETIVRTYIDLRRDGERFVDTYERVGQTPFKEALYDAD